MRKRGRILLFSYTQVSILLLAIFSFAFLVSETQRVIAPSELSTTGNPTGTRGAFSDPSTTPSPGTTAATTGGRGIMQIVTDIYGGKALTQGAFGAGAGAAKTVMFLNPLIAGVAWGATIALAVKFIAPLFGADESLTNALALAAFAGSTAGGLAAGAVSAFGTGATATQAGTFLTLGPGAIGAVVGIGVAAAVFILLYKKEKVKAVQFQCLPWEPPLGGSSCEECNKDPYRPCSEYRCKSLGQACELLNKGTTQEQCAWVGRGDVNAPTITPWDVPLMEGFRYTSHDTLPPSLGAKIIKDGVLNGCLPAFTPLEFGILTNEPAQCKIDTEHRDNFDAMQFYFGESNYFGYNHTQRISLPGPDSIEAESPELQNDGRYNMYVRCMDANGNQNVQEFDFNFCVDPSPDTTPPVIVDTSIISGSPVAFGVGNVSLDVYVNEPAECKWSIQDKNYDDMENTMACSTVVGEINARLLYTCSTNLDGIKDREENKYYFRCKDQPSKPENERNVNVQSFPFTLLGTEPLNIIKVGPNETVSGSTSVVPVDLTVETSNGAEEGKAICYISPSGEEDTYVAMFETESFEHKQTLTLPAGDYTYYFRCVDAGGNSDEDQVSFSVEVDNTAPQITRAYHELDALKIVTDEDAECAYSLNSCNFNFDEGIKLIYSNPSIQTSHFAPWQPSIAYYIKCRDEFGNQPNPNECSLIASATSII